MNLLTEVKELALLIGFIFYAVILIAPVVSILWLFSLIGYDFFKEDRE